MSKLVQLYVNGIPMELEEVCHTYCYDLIVSPMPLNIIVFRTIVFVHVSLPVCLCVHTKRHLRFDCSLITYHVDSRTLIWQHSPVVCVVVFEVPDCELESCSISLAFVIQFSSACMNTQQEFSWFKSSCAYCVFELLICI